MLTKKERPSRPSHCSRSLGTQRQRAKSIKCMYVKSTENQMTHKWHDEWSMQATPGIVILETDEVVD